MEPTASNRVTVSLDALLHNVSVIRSFIPDHVKLIAVVKDSSYGCGSTAIARTLFEEAGVDTFAVARVEEALALRHHGIGGDIIIFGKIPFSQLSIAAKHNFIFTLSDLCDLDDWLKLDIKIKFHIEIDTGMRRMGIVPESVPILITTLIDHPTLQPSGLFTHLACADVPHTTTVEKQIALFSSVITQFISHDIPIPHTHIANSAAIMRFASGVCTHVRPGIALYGCQPDPAQLFSDKLLPILTLVSSVVSLRTVPANTEVSYGGHYSTTEKTTIATIGIGYAQGIPRYLSNCGFVLINGKRYQIAGNVTMDYCMIDAGPSTTISVGDEAVFIGTQGGETITPDDIALLGDTIGYEVLCNIGSNVPRTYLRHGRVLQESNPHIY